LDIEGLLQMTIYPPPSVVQLCDRIRRIGPHRFRLNHLRYHNGDTLFHYWARYPYELDGKEDEFFEVLTETDLIGCVNLFNGDGIVPPWDAMETNVHRTRLLLTCPRVRLNIQNWHGRTGLMPDRNVLGWCYRE
jgi:hypothetical protein